MLPTLGSAAFHERFTEFLLTVPVDADAMLVTAGFPFALTVFELLDEMLVPAAFLA